MTVTNRRPRVEGPEDFDEKPKLEEEYSEPWWQIWVVAIIAFLIVAMILSILGPLISAAIGRGG